MPYWLQALIAAVATIAVALYLVKRIRNRERASLDAPEMIFNEEGELTTPPKSVNDQDETDQKS